MKKNSLVAWSHSKWLNCKDTCKSRVGKNYKRQKNLPNTKTVWEILLTHGLAEADAGRGRGGGTPSQRLRDEHQSLFIIIHIILKRYFKDKNLVKIQETDYLSQFRKSSRCLRTTDQGTHLHSNPLYEFVVKQSAGCSCRQRTHRLRTPQGSN